MTPSFDNNVSEYAPVYAAPRRWNDAYQLTLNCPELANTNRLCYSAKRAVCNWRTASSFISLYKLAAATALLLPSADRLSYQTPAHGL
jgi:hypothetical protein